MQDGVPGVAGQRGYEREGRDHGSTGVSLLDTIPEDRVRMTGERTEGLAVPDQE